MSYITNIDIETRVGTAALVALSNDSGGSTVDQAVVDEARLGAEGEADSYLARRYRVPVDLAAHPELQAVLVSFVLDLAVARLHGRRPPVPTDIETRRRAAVDWLRRVATGQVELPAASTVSPNTATGPSAQTTGDDRVLGRDEFSSF